MDQEKRKGQLVYLKPEVRKRLKDEAHRQDKSISGLIQEYIEQGLEARKEEANVRDR